MRPGIISILFISLFAQAAPTPSVALNGAGATFPYPLYSKWFSDFRGVDQGEAINYQSIGSGGGIRQLLDKTVDFGASDAPMTDEQLAKSAVPILHFPTVLGAVVLTYNVAGFTGELKLTPELASEIFRGKITKWNDAKLLKLNPKLPAMDIVVAHRSDGSGTTAIFTDYLAKASPEWKAEVGAGTAVSWPAGVGAKGNEGVTGLVKNTPGAIGYIELVYALSNKLPVASLQNSSGKFVKPSTESVTAAAAGAKIPDDFRVSITNSPAPKAYPIAGFTYLLVYQAMPAGKMERMSKFLSWALDQGQKSAPGLGYAALPKAVAAKAKQKLAALKTEAAAN